MLKIANTTKNESGDNIMDTDCIGHTNFRRFIVLSRSRTGSNMLISFLNSHSNVHAKGEIFNRLNGRNYKEIFAKVYAQQPFHIKARGFKIFYSHPLDDKSDDVWDNLISMDNLWVIHLKRRNILRTLISRKIAGLQDVWSVSSDKSKINDRNKTIVFTVEKLNKGFEQTKEWENSGDEKFKKHPLISVYYEDLVNNPEGTFGNITDFLDVKYEPPKTILRKQNPERLRDLVTNYSELKKAFSGTQWQEFFEE